MASVGYFQGIIYCGKFPLFANCYRHVRYVDALYSVIYVAILESAPLEDLSAYV